MFFVLLLLLIIVFIYIIYIARKRNIALDNTANSLDSNKRARWDFYIKSRKIATISNISLGIAMGMSFSIIIIALFYSFKIYVLCWIMFFIMLMMQFFALFNKRLLQNYNEFMGINLDLFNKNTKQFKIAQYLYLIVLDILIMGICGAAYLLYK